MLYHIDGLCPRTDIDMGRCGFMVKLWPAWRDEVAKTDEFDSANILQAVNTLGKAWLDGCGFNAWYDPDKPAENDIKKMGPNRRRLYEPRSSIQVRWGEWGPEHITIPGNACGLDIDQGLGAPRGGRVLLPHNVDSIHQAHLLLVIFTWFAGVIVSNMELREFQKK